jgi:glycosyltransferase involved in cell wall biosynthesis
MKTKPRLMVDVGPLMEDFWTGIPVFTRRTVNAVAADGRVDLAFCYQMARIPEDKVFDAIRIGAGTFLREDYETRAHVDYEPVPADYPIFYPSAKSIFAGKMAFEASTVHDMSTLLMPENHEPANVAYHLDRMIEELRTNHVTFCISQATHAALTTAYPSCTDRTRLLYQYVDWPNDFSAMDRNLPPIRIGRYAAVIGTIEPRKNLDILINALALPEMQDLDIKFVVIGRRGWLVDEFLAELPPEQRQRLVFSGFVSEFVKYRLLKAAEFLVFPSIYEGFGIPAVEAMSLGKPVLCSMTSSFPEVIGPAGLYFDPYSPSEFAAALREMLQPGFIQSLSGTAYEQSRTFTPERMADPLVGWAQELS